ncbi:protocadherin fat [Plakobranchus ocellatus]|uniref:Protocadherin fat n=1 Tax=Plakobranchus ocellatus TaxID=259542 RepID=A0AAV3Y1H6_9GAST|nr:protocadherin fat [Plakobranchus ocellatus]
MVLPLIHSSHSGVAVFPRMLSHVVCMILLHFLATFAQGQGPGVIQMSVVEESKIGTEVGQVPALQGYRYSLQDASPYFAVSSAGLVSTIDVIDREALDSTVIRLMVIGSPVGGSGVKVMHNIAVTVLDINDNDPVFQLDGGATTERISFQEDAIEGRKNILTATDPDEGLNGTIGEYRIVAGDDAGMFGLDFSGLPLILYIYKKGAESFDHEKRDRYQLTITATDSGTPLPNTGTVLVDVLILDVNDNTPAFDLSVYTTQVNESAPVGTSVFRAEATDDDDGFNGEIIYRLEDESNQFRIDENTGVIATVTSPLTCFRLCGQSPTECKPNSCFVLVEASDKGLNALTGRAYVYIEVLDENNHDPEIRFTKHDSEITVATVDENASRQTVVFTISVTDEDKGDNGKTSLSIIRGNEDGYFYHMSVPSLGINEVQVAKQLDREAVARFNLTLEARDKGTPQRSSTAHIVVLVNDANDHKPEFERSEYRASLSEFTKKHSFVASIRASDKDEGLNSKLTYEIAAGNDIPQWFSIDPDTGLVTTLAELDHEESYQVVLNISAHDGGAEPKYNYVTLTIDIEDENDYAPTFTQTSYIQEINENEPAGSEIVTLRTRDLDSGENGTVEYLVHPDTELRYPGIFKVDSVSGQLSADQRFDRETQDKYTIKVIARDNGPVRLSSTATVELTIADSNDNKPKFSPTTYYVNLQHTDPADMQVIRVNAYDKDIGVFGRITYSMSDPSNSFRINSDSGVIFNTRQLRRQTYRLVISAEDGGGNSSEEQAEVNVIVISQSSVGPEFSQRSYTFEVTEDDHDVLPQTGRRAGQVQATSRASRTVTFAIAEGDPNGVFRIGSSSGAIFTQLAIDRETTASYTLTVIAYDGEKISSTKVTIKILDVNDNKPRFVTHTTEVIVPENWPVGHNIFLAQARDADAGRNRDVSYSLRPVSGNGEDDTNGVFAIYPATGVIYLAKPPDQMPGNSAMLTVTATDAGEQRQTSSMTISIRIQDVNDHTPIFSHNRFELFLPETQAVNEIVKVMSATDEDKGRNGELTYRIIRGNEEDKFGIFPDGSLYVAHSLDRESKDMYSLTVVAEDNAVDAPRKSSVNVTVYVQDENDNAPQFTENVFEFDIMENSGAGTFVGIVKANDADIGRNSEIVYSLSDGNANFTIDPIMGTLFSKRSFDREYIVKTRNVPYFLFDVFATDNGLSKQQGRAKIRVNINDENDSPPVFMHASDTIVAISENGQVNDVVFTLQAVDADYGPNAAVSYSIIGGNEDGKFGLNHGTGKLFLKAKLDRESRDQYLLTVKATDTGSAVQLEATSSLQIFVVDYNDNAPTFVGDTPALISVSETASVGLTLAQFYGVDKDMGNNGKLRYDIVSGNSRDIFALDMYSGKLTLARALDHEMANHGEHILNISLSDSGFPALQTSKMLTIRVLDANDNTPFFDDGLSKVHIKEGITVVGSVIAPISAKDLDSGDFGKVRYSLYKQSPSPADGATETFAIDAISGEISVKVELDREKVDSYELTIHAEDQDPDLLTRRTAEKTLTIVVTDINDNAPEFESPSVFLVPYPSSRGRAIATLSATDADYGDNAKVIYSMQGMPSVRFILDENSGSITLGQSLPASPTSYTATVTATDALDQSKSVSMTATFLLYTSTGNGPVFSPSNPTSGSVRENSPRGTTIMRLAASPSSAGLNVEYYVIRISTSIGSRDYGGLFTIGRSSGVLVSDMMIDRDALESDTLNVDIVAVEKQGSDQRATTHQVNP